jgi:hypothetical protein
LNDVSPHKSFFERALSFLTEAIKQTGNRKLLNLFVALFEFHTKAMGLLRRSSLDDGKRKVVAERISALLDNASTEMKQAQQSNLAERFEAIYDEVKGIAEELSKSPGGSPED